MMGKFIGLFGILGYTSLLATFMAGSLKWDIKIHKLLALLAVIFITLHAAIIILK